MSEDQPISMLDVNLADRQALKVLPDNEECQVRIARASVVPVKSDPDRIQLALVLDVPNDPLVDDIYEWIALPNAAAKAEDLKRYTKNINRLAEFCDAFGISMPIQTEALLGREGWVVLREGEGQDGSPQNRVRRFVVRR